MISIDAARLCGRQVRTSVLLPFGVVILPRRAPFVKALHDLFTNFSSPFFVFALRSKGKEPIVVFIVVIYRLPDIVRERGKEDPFRAAALKMDRLCHFKAFHGIYRPIAEPVKNTGRGYLLSSENPRG